MSWYIQSNCHWFTTLLHLLQTPKQGLSQRAGGRGLPHAHYKHDSPAPFIGKKKERKVEPKEIPSCSILRLVLAYTRQLRILATALPNGLLQSTQSKFAFKKNRRKAQQLNAVYRLCTHSLSQFFPLYPCAHTHIYDSSISVHVPPLRQGLGWQKLLSKRTTKTINTE